MGMIILAGGLLLSLAGAAAAVESPGWSREELSVIRSLSLASLPPLPRDPSNAFRDDPRAIALGKKLFFDRRLSANKKISCASCHIPARKFTDSLPLAKGMGTTTRRTMPLTGMAYHSWFFWDGRKDSLWSQAIGPIESAVEHGVTRAFCAHLIQEFYRDEYEAVFGPLPRITHKSCPPRASPATGDPRSMKAWQGMTPEDREAVSRIYANIGKAIAAYVSRILPTPSSFDRYAEALSAGGNSAERALTPEAEAGLRLFIGKAGCIACHNGPLFSNGGFHSVGVPGKKDRGRAEAIGKVLADEFNCLGKYSDAQPEECRELRFIDAVPAKYEAAFKTPSLRNVAGRGPFMHAGQLKTVKEVLLFYRGRNSREFGHQDLTEKDMEHLEAFLETLSSPLTAP